MLFEIREANTKIVEGLFYQTNLSEHEMHIRIRALVKYQEFNTAPSRERDTTKSNEKKNDSTDVDIENPDVFTDTVPGPEQISIGGAVVRFPREDKTKYNQQLLNFLKVDDGLFTGDRALTNTERICIENNAEPFHITGRFWKAGIISEVVKNQDDLPNLCSRREYASKGRGV